MVARADRGDQFLLSITEFPSRDEPAITSITIESLDAFESNPKSLPWATDMTNNAAMISVQY